MLPCQAAFSSPLPGQLRTQLPSNCPPIALLRCLPACLLQDQSFDQKFESSNKALQVSCLKGLPVRVVRSFKVGSAFWCIYFWFFP